MKAELTAIIERATEGGYWAICPEISGANGQGETIEEAKENLKLAIQLIIEDRMADIRSSKFDRVYLTQVHTAISIV
jgi:predicted RNase H-like HicB family nuclease